MKAQKTMTANNKHITSIIRTFSTFLGSLNISDQLSDKTTTQFIKFLKQKKSYLYWSIDEVQSFISNENVLSSEADLIKKFISKYPPHQVDVFLHDFVSSLKKSDHSKSTVKNYRSDIAQFVSNSNVQEISKLFTRDNVKSFVKAQFTKDLKSTSIKRKLVSISQFAAWSERQALVSDVSFWISDVESFLTGKPSAAKHKVTKSTAHNNTKHNSARNQLNSFLLSLEIDGHTKSTVKNYKSDIVQLIKFAGDTRLEKLFTKLNITNFITLQKKKGLKHASIKRKLVSLAQFATWAEKRNDLTGVSSWLHKLSHRAEVISQVVKIPPQATIKAHSTKELKIKEPNHYSKLLKEKTESSKRWTMPVPAFVKVTKPKDNKFQSRIKSSLADFSAQINSKRNKRFLPYFNLAMIVLFIVGIGFFGYQQFIKQAPDSFAYPTTPTRPDRELSFQGRLTDTAQNPITTVTDMEFRLYDAITAGTLLWDSSTCSTTPDQDGIFNVQLGDTCGSEISENVFTENSNVWLEVDVDVETLTPRQSIKTVAYALNSETVQGYPISATGSATTNTILVMDSAGQVLLGEVSPTIKSNAGTFSIEAQALTLQTSSGSNGDIILDPDGLGEVLSTGYFSAPSATFSATYAGGTSLVLKGGPSGTGNIQEWQQSDGTVLSVVDAGGNLGIGTSNPNQKFVIATPLGAEAIKGNETGFFWARSVDGGGFFGQGGGSTAIYSDNDVSVTPSLNYSAYGSHTFFTNSTVAQGLLIGRDNTDNYTKVRIGNGTISTGNSSLLSVNGAASIGSSYISTKAPANGLIVQGNVGIGSTSPLFLLDVAGTASLNSLNINDEYTFPTIDGTNGYVLQTDGAGAVSWASVLTDSPNVGAWSHGNHFLYPDEYWADDLIIGGNSTASATFQVKVDGSGYFAGNVGIGTSAPSQAAEINGILKVGTGFTEGYTTGYSIITTEYIKADGINFRPPTVGDASFLGIRSDDNSSTIDIYSANGKVATFDGYGNSTDTVLRVFGAGFNPSSGTAVKTYIDIDPTLNTSGTYDGGIIGIDYNPTVTSLTGTHYAALFRKGNVGIGTSTPQGLFNINGAATGKALTILNETGDQNVFEASVSGSSVFTIDNSGNVGIGTTTPNGLLEVANYSAGVTRGDFIVDSANKTTYLGRLSSTTSDHTKFVVRDRLGTEYFVSDPANVKLYMNPGSTVPIGMGTSSAIAGSKLHVLLTGGKTTTAYGAYIQNTSSSSTASINKYGAYITSTGTWNGASANNIGLYVGSVTGGTNNYDAIFNGGGNVGIGTTAPVASLEIQRTDASNLFKLMRDSSGGVRYQISNGAYGGTNMRLHMTDGLDTWSIEADSSGSPLFIVDTTNTQVGINTTNPGYTLDVNGELNLTDAIRVAGDAGTSGYFLTSSAGGVNTWTDPSSITGSGLWENTLNVFHPREAFADIVDVVVGGDSTASADIQLFADGSAVFNQQSNNVDFRVESNNDVNALFVRGINGNVGIGTSAANAPLHITRPNGNDSSLMFAQTAAMNWTIGNPASTTRFDISSAANLGSSRFTILIDGNVGIGTTAPKGLFNVEGAAKGKALTILNETGDQDIFTASASGTTRVTINSAGDILPGTDDTQDLGSNSARWQDLYLGPQTLHIGTSTTDEGTIGYSTAGNTFDFTNNYGDTNFSTSSDGFNFTLGGGAGDDFIVNTDSLVVESDTGNVGIGTTDPSAKLEVKGLILTEGTSNEVRFSHPSAMALGYIKNNASTFEIGNYGSAQEIVVTGGGYEFIRFASNSKIGIGSTSPAYDLDLVGEFNLTDAIRLNTDAGTNGYLLTSSAGGLNTWTDPDTIGGIWTNTDNVYHPTNSFADVADLVLGGTSTASANVHLLSNGSAVFNQQGNDADFRVEGSGETNALFVQGSDGNVGIGTTGPNYKLDVAGAINIVNGYSEPTSESGFRLKLSDNGGINNDVGIGVSGTLGNEDLWLNTNPSQDIRFMFGTNGEKVTFEGSGNVGIGTTIPGATLDVNGDLTLRNAAGHSIGTTTSYSSIGTYQVGTITAASGFGRVYQTDTIINASANNDGLQGYRITPTFSEGAYTGVSSISMYIDGTGEDADLYVAGNVGIGTSSPQAKLHINSSAYLSPANYDGTYGRALKIGYVSNTNVYHTIDSTISVGSATQNGLQFNVHGGGSSLNQVNALTLLGNGNVGISTTTPGALLEIYVNNTTTVNPSLRIQQDGTGDLSTVYLLTGVRNWSTGVDNSDADKFKISRSSDLATNNSITIDTTDNVGIGTTDPGNRLHVAATSNEPLFIDTTTFNQVARFKSSDDITSIIVEDDDTLASYGINGTNFAIQNGSAALNNPDLVIDTNGNVGIDTTSPASKLDVSGRISQTGSASTVTGYLQTNSGSLASTTNLNPGLLVHGGDGSAANYGIDLGYNSAWRTRVFSGSISTDISFGYMTTVNPTLQSQFVENMTIKGNGNVGIGSITPGYKLDIDGDTFTNGYLYSYQSGGIKGAHIENVNVSRASETLNIYSRLNGRKLDQNSDFLSNTTTGYSVYDNASSGDTTFAVAALADAPNSSGNVLRTTYVPDAGSSPSPGWGGIYHSIVSTGTGGDDAPTNYGQYRKGSRIMQRIWANIPVGRTLTWAGNSTGDGRDVTYLTSQDGTGEWEEYIIMTTVGNTGTLSGFGHIYINGGTDTTFSWDVASYEVYAVDENPAYDKAPSLNVGYKTGINPGWGEIYATGGIFSDTGIYAKGLFDTDGDTSIQVEETGDEDIIRFDTAGTERMVIDANGNVGIGTTANVSYELEITNGTGDTTLQIETTAGTTNQAKLWLRSGTSDFIIAHDATSDSLQFLNEETETEVARIESDGDILANRFVDLNDATYYLDPANTTTAGLLLGNVGIGNTLTEGAFDDESTHLVKLRIGGEGATTADAGQGVLQLRGYSAGDEHVVGTLEYLDGRSNDSIALIKASRDAATIGYGNLRFYTSSGTGALNEKMRIDSSGNVGIGDTTPNYALDVNDTAKDIIASFTNASSFIGNITAGAYSAFGETYSNRSTFIGNNVYADTQSAVGDQLKYRNTHGSYGQAAILMSGGDTKFYNQTAATTANAVVSKQLAMIIDGTNGSVGIGTTTPLGDSADLTLGSAVGTKGSLFLYGSTAGKYSRIETTNGNLHIDADHGTGTAYMYLNYYSGAGVYFGNGASGNVGLWNSNGNVSTTGAIRSGSITQTSYNHFGAGGTASYAIDGSADLYIQDELEVDGRAYLQNGIETGRDSTDSNMSPGSYTWGYQEDGAWTSPYPDLILGYHTGVSIGGYGAYGGTRFFSDQPDRAGATVIAGIGDGGLTYFTQDVGIGDTTPSYKLDVAGEIRATSNIRANDKFISSRYGSAGTYNSSQVQGIWSIGDAYEIDTGLNDFGAQYGIVYAHTNAGTTNASKPIAGWGHQILFTNAGTRNAAISLSSGHGYFAGNVGIGTTAPTFDLEIGATSTSDTAIISVNGGSAISSGEVAGLRLEDGGTTHGAWKLDASGTMQFQVENAAGSNANLDFNTGTSNNTIRFWPKGVKALELNSTTVTIPINVNDALNFTATSTNDNRGISFNSRTALSADSSDGWMRLNSASEFGNGTYSPLLIRSDHSLRVGSTGSSFYAPISGNVAVGKTDANNTLTIRRQNSTIEGGQLQFIQGGSYTAPVQIDSWGNDMRVWSSPATNNQTQFFNTNTSCSGDCKMSVVTDGSASDYAETVFSAEDMEGGDIIFAVEANNEDGITTYQTTSENDSRVIGVISTAPGSTLKAPMIINDELIRGTLVGKYTEETQILWPELKPLALSGRVPVKVITPPGENITTGKTIVSSSEKGIGQQAKVPSMSVGKTITNFNPSSMSCTPINSVADINWPSDEDGNNAAKPCYTLPDGRHVGKIMIMVSNSYIDPTIIITNSGELSITGDNTNGYQIENQTTQVSSIGAFFELFVANITAGLTNTQTLIVEQTASITDLSVDTLTINGQSLADYINSVVGNQTASNGTSLISPVDNDTAINIATKSGSVVFRDPSQNTVAEITQDGDLSLLGNLVTESVTATGSSVLGELLTTNATVSGTLTATNSVLGSLLAESATISGSLTVSQDASIAGQVDAASARITLLEAGMAQLEDVRANTAQIVTATISGTLYADNIYDFENKIADSLQQPGLLDLLLGTNETPNNMDDLYDTINKSEYSATSSADLDLSISELSLVSEDITLTGSALFIEKYFKVNGAGYISDSLAIGNSLFVGNGMQIADGLIEYTTADPDNQILAIQPSGNGSIELLAGIVTIDDSGVVTVNGDLDVTGDIKTNTLLTDLIKPTDFGNPLQVQVAGVDTATNSVKESRFEIINEVGAPVATFSAQGNAEFAGKVDISGGIGIASQDLGSDDSNELTANKTSGKATIKSGANEVKINSELITDDTLIYVTAVGSTNNQVIFVKNQTAEDTDTPELEGMFVVGFDNNTAADVSFNWWIVN